MNLEGNLAEGAQNLGLELSSQKIETFIRFMHELKKWNQKFNLTSIKNDEEIIQKHFLDSLSLVKAANFERQKIMDIGTGAGFPGLALKIAFPHIHLILVEATQKKTTFLEHIIQELGLQGIEVIWSRAESLPRKYLNQFDIVCARAVAKLKELVKYSLPYVKPRGIFIAQKTENIEDEIREALPIIKKYHGKIDKKILVEIGDLKRQLIVIKHAS